MDKKETKGVKVLFSNIDYEWNKSDQTVKTMLHLYQIADEAAQLKDRLMFSEKTVCEKNLILTAQDCEIVK